MLFVVVNSHFIGDVRAATTTGLEEESRSMNGATAATITVANSSTGDQAIAKTHNWISMQVRSIARAEAEDGAGLIQFVSQAELLKFIAAHQESCSITTLEKYLTSINRTAIDE